MQSRPNRSRRATFELLAEVGALWFVLAFFWIVGATSLTYVAQAFPTLIADPRGENVAQGFLIVVIFTAAARFLFRQAALKDDASTEGATPPLAASSAEEDGDSHRANLVLLWLRWLAIGALLAVIHTAWMREHVTTTAFFSVAALLGLGALINVLLTIGRRRLTTRRAVGLQLGFDIGLQGAIVHIAGGLASPLAGLFVIQSLLAGFLLNRDDGCRVVLSIGTFCLLLAAMDVTLLGPSADNLVTDGLSALEILAWSATVAMSVVIAGLTVNTLAERVRLSNYELTAATHRLEAETAVLQAAREQLIAEQQKLHSIVGCMADAVVFADPQGRVRFHNKAAAGLWADRGGDADLRVCHTDAHWQKLLDKLKNPGLHEIHPVLVVGSKHFDASYARVCTPEGKLLGAVMVARDITDRILAQRNLMEDERAATIQRMAGSIAHELNNPLSAITLFTQHAQKHVDASSPLSGHLGTVRKNAELCTKIVRQLLNYTRPRNHERQTVAVTELLEDAANTLAAHATAAAVTLRCPPSASPLELSAVPDQLRQVLVNLGLNAIDATREGGTVTFRTRTTPSTDNQAPQCVLEVADTGTGIDEAVRDKIFDAFFTTKLNGTGLGLAVVHDIVRDHGGHLEVLGPTRDDGSADSGTGTTFRVTLPIADLELALPLATSAASAPEVHA